MPGSVERARADLHIRLEARRAEIEESLLTRVFAVDDLDGGADPEYAEGLRSAVGAALDYGLAIVHRGEEGAPQVPAALRNQARAAARRGVSLETVLRRYFAGYTLIGDFLVEEASRSEFAETRALKRILRSQAALFDRLLEAVSEEYAREQSQRPVGFERRRIELIGQLLAGELVDASPLAYDFDRWHLGLIAAGDPEPATLRGLLGSVDCSLLSVRQGDGSLFAWLGTRRRPDPVELQSVIASAANQHTLAIGEPGEGLRGWRATHRQAAAALPIALRGPQRLVRYVDVALLASIAQDDVLVASLRQLYLDPLELERDGGEALRETLNAYFGSERNVSSAASALGVKRHTVTNRLRAVEERIGRPLSSCAVEVEVALRLHAR